MQCTDALDWLRNKLLPAVRQWLIAKEIREFFPWRRVARHKELAAVWDECSQIRERRGFPLIDCGRYRQLGLVRTSELLQGDMGYGSPQLYLTTGERRNLYQALAAVIKGRHGYVPYLASNLGLRDDFGTHLDLSEALTRHAKSADAKAAIGLRSSLYAECLARSSGR